MKHAIVLLLAAASVIAADATGRWSGALIVKDDGGERSLPALFVLKQEGAVVTGTGGPPNDPSPLQNGKLADGVITFELSRDGSVLRFKLKLNVDEIAGDVTREHDGQTEQGRLLVKREK